MRFFVFIFYKKFMFTNFLFKFTKIRLPPHLIELCPRNHDDALCFFGHPQCRNKTQWD